ncbi:MAG: sulfite exporter TauE/SafE family protein [Sphaerobacter sp.]|nr:sulfite exporter TauE/SafE family protein [Sphaerobacter sp.]
MVLLAGLLSGATGFGFSLVSAPLLLAGGFSLPFVVALNLTLGLLTRISVAYQLRRHVTPRRVGLLAVGSVPGLALGTLALTRVDPAVIQRATGLVALLAAIGLARGGAPVRAGAGGVLVTGLAAGFLGATTSLNGVPPALLLVRERAAPFSFLADLALFFIVSNGATLGLLHARGAVHLEALLPLGAMWLPAALLGNSCGVRLAGRLPAPLFRATALTVIAVSGVIAVLGA